MADQNSSYRHKLNTLCSRQRWPWKKGDCVSEGPQHATTWKCQIFVKDVPYEGTGTSKDKAFEIAARNALVDLKEKYPDEVSDVL